MSDGNSPSLERRVCAVLGHVIARHSASRRGAGMTKSGLTADIVELARQYGRYGYRKIAALLRGAGRLRNFKSAAPATLLLPTRPNLN